MLRSLFSGISGLRAHQTMMDTTGNNIANVNTVGYKSSQVVFEDTLSQMVKAAGAPQGGNGGTNPAQVGLGVKVAAISTNFSQGSAQTTGKSTDLMVQGDGFFVVKNSGEDVFTRAGAFSFDADGRLTSPDGGVVQGWTGVNGKVDTQSTPGDVVLRAGTLLPPVSTSAMTLGGNLPAASAVYAAGPPETGGKVVTKIDVFDGQGGTHPLALTITKASANTWDVSYSLDGGSPTTLAGALTFDASTGAITTTAPLTLTGPGGAISADVSKLSQFGGATSASALSQNGSSMGTLNAFSLSPDGTLVGVFSNGLKQPLAQVALATFNNPPGLEKVGNSQFRASVNSGTPQLGAAGGGGRGLLSSGTLEMSNVDLAQEFTNLIVAQRGFQANSRVITTSDSILEDLVNLKR